MGFEQFTVASGDSTKPSPPSLGSAAWLSETVVNPAVNAAIIDPYDVVSCVVQDLSHQHLSLGTLNKLSVNEAKPYTASWFVESAAGGIGSLVPFVIAQKLTGGAMRGTGRLFEVEGAKASFLASERVAQLAGAGAYAGMKRPHVGETRAGNAASTMAGFALFDAGNALSGSLPLMGRAGVMALVGRAGVRAGIGMVGGGVQTELASLLGHGQLADKDQVVQNAVAGGFLNLGLGAAQDASVRALDAVNMKIGRGAPVTRYTKLSDLVGKVEALDAVVKANPLARVQETDSNDAWADLRQNKVYIPKSDDGSLLGHELTHLSGARNGQFENGFRTAGRLLDQGRADEAWLSYKQTRLEQELAARSVQNTIADAMGSTKVRASISPDDVLQQRTSTGQSYEANWLKEFKLFQAGNHNFRPVVDFMDGGYGRWERRIEVREIERYRLQEVHRLIDRHRIDEAWQIYKGERLKQDLAALVEKTRAAYGESTGWDAERFPQRRTETGRTYEAKWLIEFRNLRSANRDFRPNRDGEDVDEEREAYERGRAESRALRNEAAGFSRIASRPDEIKALEGKPVESRAVETKAIESKPVESSPVERSYERWYRRARDFELGRGAETDNPLAGRETSVKIGSTQKPGDPSQQTVASDPADPLFSLKNVLAQAGQLHPMLEAGKFSEALAMARISLSQLDQFALDLCKPDMTDSLPPDVVAAIINKNAEPLWQHFSQASIADDSLGNIGSLANIRSNLQRIIASTSSMDLATP